MSGLLDFLQAASNAAASNVSGPIDLIAAGLRAAGVPVPRDALLSSEWMERKGLTKPVKQSAASLAGETAGLLTPIAAAAKAPQIAAGLLKMGENAAAPGVVPRLNERGAIVWHGSPHRFDKFDSSKIGTGEGAQAYGHGLYLAESPDVAAQYQRNLTANTVSLDGKPLSSLSTLERAAADYATEYGGVKRALETLDNTIARGSRFDDIEWLKQVREKLATSNYAKNEGALYKVDLPDEAIAKMLDWDKPLSQQAPEVQAALRRAYDELAMDYPSKAATPKTGAGVYSDIGVGFDGPANSRQAAANSHQKASDYLRELGIPGIRYLDGGSRGAGGGTSNFVVFPGEEGLLKILERNGSPL